MVELQPTTKGVTWNYMSLLRRFVDVHLLRAVQTNASTHNPIPPMRLRKHHQARPVNTKLVSRSGDRGLSRDGRQEAGGECQMVHLELKHAASPSVALG